MRNWCRLAAIPAFALAGSLVLGGCGDDKPTEPEQESGLEFTYDGARTGGYSSDGSIPTIGSNGLPDIGSWAVARPDSLGGLVIAGFEPTGGSKGDLFILQLHPIRTGAFSDCGVVGSDCHGRLIVGVDTSDLSAVEAWFEITAGTVNLSEASSSRVQGTFSATFVLVGGSDTLSVNDGVIDVPFSSDPFVGGGISCLARNLEAGSNDPC